MSAVFGILSLLFIAFAVMSIQTRPGLFAGVGIGTYGYAIHFGSIGMVIYSLMLLIAAAHLAAARDRPVLRAELWLAAWAGLSLLSVLLSWHTETALFFAGFLIAQPVAGYFYGRAFGDHPRFVPDLVLASCITLVLCAPGIFTQGGDYRDFSNLSAVGISTLVDLPLVGCIVLLMLHDTLRPAARLGLAAFLALVVAAALALGTRSVLTGAGAAFAVVAVRWWMARSQRTKWIAGVLALAAVAAAGSAAAWLSRHLETAPPMIQTVSRSVGLAPTPYSHADRILNYTESVRLIADAPLLGHGIGAFGDLANFTTGDLGYPHNLELEILVGTGAIGLVLFAMGFVPIFARGLRAAFVRPVDWMAVLVFGILVDSFVRHQTNFSAFHAKSLFLALGIVVARNYAAFAPQRVRPWRANAPAHQP